MLRGCIIGFGRMGLTHFSILNALPGVRMVAICDASGLILKNAERYMAVETFVDPGKMLDTMTPDFVVVATPTATHAEAVRMAVQRGIPVFVEKPLALNVAQGRDVLDLLDRHPVVNQIGYVLRFNDVFLKVKKLLDNGTIGDILSFKMEMYGPTVLHDAKKSWRSKKNQGGGCLYDFASHSIDLINYFIGMPDEVTGTVLRSIHSAGVEDMVTSTFLYASGMQGNLLVNWSDPSYRKPAYRFEVFGRKGKIIADLHEYRLFLQARTSLDGFAEGWNRRYVTNFFRPVNFYLRGYEFTRQLEHFVACVSANKPTQVNSLVHGHQADMVIERLRQDAERMAYSYG